jgi:hypothetical protein
MPLRLCLALALLLLVLVLSLPSSFAWGDNAQRLITNKAVETLPDDIRPFFESNRQFLAQRVTDPEEAEKKDPKIENLDFIKIDHYGQFPFANLPRTYTAAVSKFGRRSVSTYGLLPWQVGTYSKKLTDAFHDHNWADAKMSAAYLAHYVAESHDPFNTTMNWDGKLSNQLGVNERFRTGLVDRFQLFFFVKPNEAVFIHDPTDHAFEMVLSAHSWLENILLSDMRAHQGLSGYTDEYYDRFYAQAGAVLVRQLSDASTDLGSYWMSAWINAGRPQLPRQ